MEGAKRKIHRLRNSVSRRLSSNEMRGPEPKTDGDVNANTNSDADKLDDISKEQCQPLSSSENKSQSHPAVPTSAASGGIRAMTIPKSFTSKKDRILADLAVPDREYSDKSPKGSVDESVKEVIELINAVEGWVTTSSCAGRVSVFVEGLKGDVFEEVEGDGEGEGEGDADGAEGERVMNGVDGADVHGIDAKDEEEHERERGTRKIRTGPGGKGGGRWLYVSHDPIPDPASTDEPDRYTKLFGLEPMSISSPAPFQSSFQGKALRLIHLSFSPLILHALCAALPHARPLLAAAINAGFRESGVQSLKALDDDEAGVMLGIRTAGLVFSTVIGVVLEGDDGKQRMQAIVGEDYLKMCVGIVNERFQGNERRKERLLNEIGRAREELQGETGGAESKEERRQRKREEGLRRQEEVKENEKEQQDVNRVVEDHQFEDGLSGLENR